MQLSVNQETILQVVSQTNDNIIISGVAGCGKSTTLQLIANQIKQEDSTKSILYLAFNNEICSDIAPKLEPLGVDVLTFHKWGNRAIGWKKNIHGYKYTNQISKYFEDRLEMEGELPFSPLLPKQAVKVIDLIRLWYVQADSDTVVKALEQSNVELPEEWYTNHLEAFSQFVTSTIKWGLDEKGRIDFVDMLVFPIVHRLPLKRYDVILVDECQDLSNIMHKMIKTMRSNSRIIAVGDAFQSINGFAGASFNSFNELKELISAIELPLSTCYRCGNGIIELAQEYVPHIKGTDKPGSVNRIPLHDMFKLLDVKDLVICRRNAPLVSLAFKLILKGFKVIIKGRQFGDYVLSYVYRIKKEHVAFEKFLSALDETIGDMIKKTKNDERIEMLKDVYNCLESIIENSEVDDYDSLIRTVDNIFSDVKGDDAVTLSSFHRSKGLQNETVWILLDKPLAPPSGGNKDQESNLAYVAITRAISKLYMVPFTNR